MSDMGVPGPKTPITPRVSSSAASSGGTIPPPKTMMSVAARPRSSSSTRGEIVMWPPQGRRRFFRAAFRTQGSDLPPLPLLHFGVDLEEFDTHALAGVHVFVHSH